MNEMNEVLRKEFERQEKEDQERMTVCFEEAVREELDLPEKYLQLLRGKEYSAKEIMDLSVRVTPVRVASELNVRKHTLCQIPYYHGHDFYELIYVYRGNGGQYFPGGQPAIHLNTGDICILTPGKIHGMMPADQEDIVLKLVIPRFWMKGILTELEKDSDLKNWVKMLYKKNELYFFRTGGMRGASFHQFMEALLMELYRQQGNSMLAVRCLLTLFFIDLGRMTAEIGSSDLLQNVIEYIWNHICTVDLDMLSAQLGYSSRHLARRIAEETGTSFTGLLTQIRLQKASDLLAETDLILEEVARQSGYRNTSGLYKRFRAVYGMSPGEYRKIYHR